MKNRRLLLLPVVLCLSLTAFAAETAAQGAPAPYHFQNVTLVAGGFITGFVADPQQRELYYVRTDIGGAYRWDAGAERWTPLLDWLPISERNLLGVESVAVDPTDARKLYIAAGTYVRGNVPDGAILRSDDEGRHFTIVRVPFKMGGNEDGRFAGERLEVDPNHPGTLLMGTRQAGLWRSDDYGASWQRVAGFPAPPENNDGLTFVTFDAGTGRAGQPTPAIYVGVDDPVNNLMRSEDGGATWKPVTGGPQGMFPNHGTFSREGILYLSYTDHPGPNGVGNGGVWAYTPRTNRWRDITPEKPGGGGEQQYHFNGPRASADAQGFGYGIVVVDAEHPRTLLASTIDRWHPGDTIFRSTDGGGHWVSLKEGATRDGSLAPWVNHVAGEAPFGHWIGAAMIDPFNGAHVLYGTGETIWESHDVNGGAATHWTVGARGLEEPADIMLLSPALRGNAEPHLFTGLGDIGCFRNEHFARSPAGGAMKDPELSNCDSLAMAAGDTRAMVRVGRSWTPGAHGAVSRDGGLHWTPFASEPAGGARGGSASISTDGKVLLWAVPWGETAMSRDDGASWQPVAVQGTGRRPLEVVENGGAAESFWVYDAGSGALYAVGADGAGRVVNGAAPRGGWLRMAAGVPGTLWIASAGGLWRSVDGGAHFAALDSVASATAVGFGKAAPGSGEPAIYLIGALAGTPEALPPGADEERGGGIYRSVDGGATWRRIDDAEHRYATADEITGDPRIYGRVYIGTNGRGVIWGNPAR